jgi:hypothetical protein
MFPSHLIGPVARVAYDDPLSAVNHERRLALARRPAPSTPPQPGSQARRQPASRIPRFARSVWTALRLGDAQALRS